MRAVETATAIVVLLIGIATAVSAWVLGAGWGNAGPEAGFYPFCLGILMTVTGIALVAQALVLPQYGEPFALPDELRSVAKVALPAIGMVALIHFIGVYVATAIYLGGYMRWIGRHSWPLVLLIALGTPLLSFAVFELWLGTSLPKGPIETWLGF